MTPGEDPDYLSRQLITYIGNKRALLGQIGGAVERVKRRLGRDRLRIFDAFSGSGVVSRFFKGPRILAHQQRPGALRRRDRGAATCATGSTVDFTNLARVVADLNARVDTEPLPRGFIEELYAPRDESRITQEDRVFYTKSNARRLDNYRRLIDTLPLDMRDMLLGPLLSRASVHAHTAGVFKGFYKTGDTGVGRFGGSGGDALVRIMGEIRLDVPVLSRFECEYSVLQEDANAAARRLKGLDLVYVDPPYNQHPYGSNYFMLDLLVRYERPERISRVSGIPTDWQRSGYNVKARSLPLLSDLLESVDAPFLLISFNNEGFISTDEMRGMLNGMGAVDVLETRYNAFRGSRNFDNRPVHVTEQLFLVERR